MKEKNKILGILGMVVGLALALLFLCASSFFIGAGLLNILGFKYTSIGDVILFFVIYTIIAFFLESFIEAFVMLVKELGGFNRFISNFISFFFFVGFDIVLISAVESNISGIMISDKTIILFSIISYIAGKFFEGAAEEDETLKTRVKKGFGKKQREKEEEK